LSTVAPPEAHVDTVTFQQFETASLADGFSEVLERHWGALTQVATHAHPFDAHALIVRGEMWLTEGDTTRHLGVGDTFDLARTTPHAERYGHTGATYWVARRN
jgi:hypothetical protein